MTEFSENIASGSVANLIFMVIFGVGAWIKSRLQQSNCKMDCGCLTCDSSLVELKTIKDKLHHTQRDQLEFLREILVHVQPEPQKPVLNPRPEDV